LFARRDGAKIQRFVKLAAQPIVITERADGRVPIRVLVERAPPVGSTGMVSPGRICDPGHDNGMYSPRENQQWPT